MDWYLEQISSGNLFVLLAPLGLIAFFLFTSWLFDIDLWIAIPMYLIDFIFGTSFRSVVVSAKSATLTPQDELSTKKFNHVSKWKRFWVSLLVFGGCAIVQIVIMFVIDSELL